MKTVTCQTHGEGPQAFICQHSLQTLGDLKARGFKFSRDKNNAINAWCNDCHDHLLANGYRWDEKTEAYAGIKVVCESCAAVVAGVNEMESKS